MLRQPMERMSRVSLVSSVESTARLWRAREVPQRAVSGVAGEWRSNIRDVGASHHFDVHGVSIGF